MNRRNFFTKLFGSAIAGVGVALAPRCYPSVDGVRNLTGKVTAFPEWHSQALGTMQSAAILRQYMRSSVDDDLALATRMVPKRKSD